MNRDLYDRLRTALVHNWWQKLAAVILAVFVWWFVSVNTSEQTLASLQVPIEVEGVSPDTVATGLPDTVIVTIQGPSRLVERLQRQSVAAVLDLSGITGEFEQSITVLIPQGAELLTVSPAEVIGSIEPISTRDVPVEVVLIGVRDQDLLPLFQVEPVTVQAQGLESTLQQVTHVIAPVRSGPGERTVTLYAAGADGLPLPGLTLTPLQANVTVTEMPILESRTVELALLPPDIPGHSVAARLDSTELSVSGPPSVLAGLERVTATAQLPEGLPPAGSHTVPLSLQLPEGVHHQGQPTATLRVTPTGMQQ